jgi:hypothetical protein
MRSEYQGSSKYSSSREPDRSRSERVHCGGRRGTGRRREHGHMRARWGELVVDATSAVLDTLEPFTGRRWDMQAGDLEWTCHETAVHVASDLIKYAAQLAGHIDDTYLRFDVTASDDESPEELLRIIHGCGRVLASVVDSAPRDARAWHWGPTDASGFAAMAIGELLVHTYDITRGLGSDWLPPRDLAQAVVARLHEGGRMVDDPSALLLWSTGRIDIAGLDHVDDWVWRAASG